MSLGQIINHHGFHFLLLMMFVYLQQDSYAAEEDRSWVSSDCFDWGLFRAAVDPNRYFSNNETMLRTGEPLGKAIEACCYESKRCNQRLLGDMLDSPEEQQWTIKKLAEALWCSYRRYCGGVGSCSVVLQDNGDVSPRCDGLIMMLFADDEGSGTEPGIPNSVTESPAVKTPGATSPSDVTVVPGEGATGAAGDNGHPQTYVIVGAAVGGVVVVAVTAALLVVAIRRHRTNKRRDQDRSQDQNYLKTSSQRPSNDNPLYHTTKPAHVVQGLEKRNSDFTGSQVHEFSSDFYLYPQLQTETESSPQFSRASIPPGVKGSQINYTTRQCQDLDKSVHYYAASMYLHPPADSQYNNLLCSQVSSEPNQYEKLYQSTRKYDPVTSPSDGVESTQSSNNHSGKSAEEKAVHDSQGYLRPFNITDDAEALYEGIGGMGFRYDYVDEKTTPC